MLPPLQQGLKDEAFFFQAVITINAIIQKVFARRQSVTADYTVEKFDGYIGVTDTSVARTITLPGGVVEGHQVIVKDESGAAGTNNITIDGNGTETIDGALTVAIDTNYGAMTLISNGAAAWFITSDVLQSI